MSDDNTFRMRDYLEGTDGKTPCPKCGALIALSATTCPHCGVHFRGRAEDFSPASREYRSNDHLIVRRIAIVLLILIGLMILFGVVAFISGMDMSFWITKRDSTGGRSLFSINLPIMWVIALMAFAIGCLLPLIGWLFR